MNRKEAVMKKLEETVEALGRFNKWDGTKTEVGDEYGRPLIKVKTESNVPLIDIETFIEMIKLGLYDKSSNNEPEVNLIRDSPYLPYSLKIKYQDKTYKTLTRSR